MRGGSLPLLAWASLLVLSTTGLAIVTGDRIQIAEFIGAILLVVSFAGWFAANRREALRRGEPAWEQEAEAAPDGSLGAVGIGLGFASILFGLTWADFLVGFGAGLMVLSAGRLVLEHRAQSASERAVRDPSRAVPPSPYDTEAAP